MKKLFTLLVAIGLWSAILPDAQAQTVDQGAWMIGGTAGYSSTKFQESDITSSIFYLTPTVGIYLIDDLAVGLGFGYSSVKIGDNTENSTAVSPFIRYYPINYIFLQAGVDIGLDDSKGVAFGGAIGYSWFLNSNIALEPQLYYENYNQKGESGDYSTFGLALGLQAFIGR